jgi:hypothetical protein
VLRLGVYQQCLQLNLILCMAGRSNTCVVLRRNLREIYIQLLTMNPMAIVSSFIPKATSRRVMLIRCVTPSAWPMWPCIGTESSDHLR